MAHQKELYLCPCTKVTHLDISKNISLGCESISCLRENTGVGSVCGTCLPLLNQFFNMGQALSENKKEASWLTIAGLLSLILSLLYLFSPQFQVSQSVQQTLSYSWLFDPLMKQLTGFSMLILILLMSVLSFKRFFPNLLSLSFSASRGIHVGLASVLPLLVIIHTGSSMGENLNFYLSTIFITSLITGSITSVIVARDLMQTDEIHRSLRKVITGLHIFVLWTLPVLLGFHVLSYYYF